MKLGFICHANVNSQNNHWTVEKSNTVQELRRWTVGLISLDMVLQ